MAFGILEPSVAQPPLPLQLFLALQPLSLLLQPPWPLQSFFPLQECFAGLVSSVRRRPTLAAFTVAPLEEVGVAALATVVPPINPESAAVRSSAFRFFILTSLGLGRIAPRWGSAQATRPG